MFLDKGKPLQNINSANYIFFLVGTYGCLVDNDTYHEQRITTEYKPEIQTSNLESSSIGSQVTLSCLVRSNNPSALSISWLFNGNDPGCDPIPCNIFEEFSKDSLMSKWSMTINKDNVGLYSCVVTDDVLQYSNDYELTAHDGTPTIFDIDVPNGEKEGNEENFVVYKSKIEITNQL